MLNFWNYDDLQVMLWLRINIAKFPKKKIEKLHKCNITMFSKTILFEIFSFRFCNKFLQVLILYACLINLYASVK